MYISKIWPEIEFPKCRLPKNLHDIFAGFIFASVPSIFAKFADVRLDSQYGAVFAVHDSAINVGMFTGVHSLS